MFNNVEQQFRFLTQTIRLKTSNFSAISDSKHPPADLLTCYLKLKYGVSASISPKKRKKKKKKKIKMPLLWRWNKALPNSIGTRNPLSGATYSPTLPAAYQMVCFPDAVAIELQVCQKLITCGSHQVHGSYYNSTQKAEYWDGSIYFFKCVVERSGIWLDLVYSVIFVWWGGGEGGQTVISR